LVGLRSFAEAIYEHTVIGRESSGRGFAFRLTAVGLVQLMNNGDSASAAALLFAALFGLGFIQIQRPHLPHGHALRQGALRKTLARALLAHFVASAALLPQHVRHFTTLLLFGL
jgi:hypothetical protein